MDIFYSFLVIIIAYLLGSIPFGYLITRFSTGKNILEIGWRKTSGSNVFRNVGFWQGVLTGILDVGKGSLAVWIVQNTGLPSLIQVLSGVAAVIGHNWSIFLKFAGGRGIGTFIGVLLVMSPKILGLSVIPFLILALIWNSSIGTILFLFTTIFLGIHLNQIETVGLFGLISLFPIFIKRLSPVNEIFPIKKKLALVRNRLIFDDDEFCSDLRIKRIIKKLTKK